VVSQYKSLLNELPRIYPMFEGDKNSIDYKRKMEWENFFQMSIPKWNSSNQFEDPMDFCRQTAGLTLPLRQLMAGEVREPTWEVYSQDEQSPAPDIGREWPVTMLLSTASVLSENNPNPPPPTVELLGDD
jgi:hypothetical protein